VFEIDEWVRGNLHAWCRYWPAITAAFFAKVARVAHGEE